MKTRQEMIYEFMLATSTNHYLAKQCTSMKDFVDTIYQISELMADKVLEKST